MSEIGTLLKVPRGTPGLVPLELDMEHIKTIEKRSPEVAYVNKETAPELLSTFNQAYCEVLRMMTQIAFEKTQAVKYADMRKAIVILEVAPAKLKEKGLATQRSPGGSEDLRQAVLALDTEFLDLQDKVNMIQSVYDFLKVKAKNFENSYNSVKKIYDVRNGALGNQHQIFGPESIGEL